ncbi:MAG: hypothetical protein KIT09_25320 [Bryobacteraceae bacterium]|nr:hypothetical protein [Bryobacteraceae bacterium]
MTRLTFLGLAAFALGLWAESAGGIRWTAPAGWKAQPQRPMRAATYVVPRAAGDAEDGECAVFYFGAGQGGGVDANVKRWIAQFELPDGKPAAGAAKTGKKTIAGMPATTIDLSGTYLASAGPMAASQVKKPGYRLIGAIIEAPEGNVFFKFTGPAKTVAAAQPQLEKLLSSVQKL